MREIETVRDRAKVRGCRSEMAVIIMIGRENRGEENDKKVECKR